MWDKLSRFWYPDYLKLDRTHEEYLRFIIGLAQIGLLVEVAYVALNMLNGIPVFPTNAPLLGFLGLLLTVRFSRTYGVAAHAFLGVFCLSVAGLAHYYRSFPYTIFLWIPVFSIMSVYLVGKIKGAFWSATLVVLAISDFLHAQGKSDFGYVMQVEQIGGVVAVSIILTTASALYASTLFSNYISRLSQELDKQNKILLEQKQSLEENMEEKKTLISIVCHDIANPLAVILATADLAVKRSTVTLQGMGRVNRSALIIKDLIEDVRTHQAVESGKFHVELGPTDLRDVFKNIEFIFADRLETKNIQLVFDYDNEENLWVEAEEKSLTHSVVSNLISNAIKFSQPNDTIVVQVTARDEHVHLMIRDHGIGMPESIVHNLFRRDKQTSRLGTKGERGAGFGMPIAKIYMEKYGGDLSVASLERTPEQEEHGTTFTLRFSPARSRLKRSV